MVIGITKSRARGDFDQVYWLPDMSEKALLTARELFQECVAHRLFCQPREVFRKRAQFFSIFFFSIFFGHISVGFSELQCTSWGSFPEHWCCSVPMRPHLSVIYLCRHTQVWILKYLHQLQLCNPPARGEHLPAQSEHPTMQLCCAAVPGGCSSKAG